MATTTEATEAPALAELRRMLDERWPRRSRVADRILGRDGDHAKGNAIDISYDPVSGPDLERLAAAILRDPRTAVVLWRGRIAEPGVAGGAWRPSAGLAEGSHAGHLHLSIDPRRRASQAAWPVEIAEGETGDVFWPFDSEQAKEARRAQREYLRGTWVRDTALGKFLRLDEPDGPAPAKPAPARPSPGFEYYGHGHVDADTGGSKLAQAGKEAARGASIGGTVGTVLEAVPVVGPILHGAATVIGAIGGFFAGLGRVSFHPDGMAAAAWLALFSLNPAMMYSGIDGIDVDDGEARAARLVRYFLLVSRTVPPAGKLYNPKSDRKDNAYMQKVDPRFPQTNPRHNRRIKWAVMARRRTAPEVTTPVAAQSLLSLIRKVLAKSGVMQWDEAKEHIRELRYNLRHVRWVAGETGRDINLEVLFRGNVSPKLGSFPPLPKHRVVPHPKKHRRETGDTAAPPEPVIIYGASWCGPCHRAADYQRERGVAFVMKDIDQTVGARAEMETKLARAGLQPRAIPVIDVGGRILVGFNPAALDDALRTAGFATTPPTAGPRARVHEVTRSEAYAAKVFGSADVAMENIARAWGALDRTNWFSELMRANPDKARDRYGYWATLVEGEMLWIPAAWPEPPAGPRKKIVIPPETNGPASVRESAEQDTSRIDDWDFYPTPGFHADE